MSGSSAMGATGPMPSSNMGNAQNMYNQLSNAGQNPYYDQLAGTYQANADRAMNSALNTVDQRSGAAGMAGSSRAGIASGMAMRDVNTDLQSNLANLAYTGYNQNLQNRMQLAQAADQAAMQKYGADLGYAGTVYGADRGLEGTKYASDNSLKGNMYSADQGLKGTMYASDNSLAGTRYASDNSLKGTMYSSDAARDASMYGADRSYAANIYGTDMQGYLGQLNNAAQMYGMDQNYALGMGNVANNAANIQNMYNLGMAQNNTANSSILAQMLGGMQGSISGGMQMMPGLQSMGGYRMNNAQAPLQGLQYYAGALGQPTVLGSGGSFGSGYSNGSANSMGMNMAAQAGTVICTELHRQGLMPDDLIDADRKFGLMVRTFDPDTYDGYIAWAPIVVKAMRKSKAVTKLVASIALPWAKEMGRQMGLETSGGVIGRAVMRLGVPVCRWIGATRKVMSDDVTAGI